LPVEPNADLALKVVAFVHMMSKNQVAFSCNPAELKANEGEGALSGDLRRPAFPCSQRGPRRVSAVPITRRTMRRSYRADRRAGPPATRRASPRDGELLCGMCAIVGARCH